MDKKKGRGFASMTPERLKEIASQGGKKAHATGAAYKWDRVKAQEASRRAHEKRRKDFGGNQ